MQKPTYQTNLRETRHITFYINNERYTVPAYSKIETIHGAVKVQFIFQAEIEAIGIEYVTADNEQGYIRMVTSNGNPFNTGSLYDQLFVWYDYILKR